MLSTTLFYFVPLLLGIVSRGNATPEPLGFMARYEVPNDSPQKAKDDSKNKPTWFAQYPADTTGMQHPESYQTNLDLAEAHFKWLTDPQNGQRLVYGDSGWLTISVMYDPVSKWHFASTLPRGPRNELMWRTGQRDAPAWWKAVKEPGAALELHSEDAVYFNYEISDKAHVSTDPNKKPYPEGAVVATWGHQKINNHDIFKPGKLPSCSSSRKRPTCQQVAGSLGVNYQKDPAADADKAAAAGQVVTEDYFAGMTEEQIEEFMCEPDFGSSQRRRVAIKGREVQLEQRGSCKKPVHVSAFTYKKTTSSSPPKPKPSCYQQNQDPDQGITTEYCVCDKSRTLPFLTISPTVVRTKSCEYTSLPPKNTKRDAMVASIITSAPTPTITPRATLEQRDLTITKDLGPPTTNKKLCQVCTRVVNNEDSCHSMKDCIVQTGKVTIEAGTSSVHVGTLTGSALYTSVSSALNKICPTPTSSGFTSCKTDTVSIGKIPYVSMDFLSRDGELQVSVESSKYNVSSIRTGLIKAAAAAAQHAATGKNCYEQKYEISQLTPSRRSWMPSWLPEFMRRGDIQPPRQGKATWCNTVGFSGPHYYNPYWKLQSEPGATDYMDVHFQFHEKSGGEFDCAILEGAAGALAFLGPEFAIGDVGLAEAIGILCEGASKDRRDVNSTLLDMPV
ncbi:hypothetical protein F4779DRAFT_638430 [Xylariaceae sp. FL0662B]|nr:hypothetical protein F4779DRAFT_638430 [Xylariaceae sp. FL0662B]